MNGTTAETVTGYVVDLACLRRYARDEYAERARKHTTECAVMGHCVESGYAVVDDDGTAHLLDTHATTHVVAALRETATARGVHLVVERRRRDQEMVTESVEEQSRGSGIEAHEDEFGHLVNPPGPPAGDPGRRAHVPRAMPERNHDAFAEAAPHTDADNIA